MSLNVEQTMKEILVPISPGELLDKITILRIKSARMSDAAKVANVRNELATLEQVWREAVGNTDVSADERDKELAQAFDARFIELARSVYIENDERAAIKKRINVQLGSRIVEEKSYKPYRPA